MTTLRALRWVVTFVVVGMVSSAGLANATPPPPTPGPERKVDTPVDENDPLVIEARRYQRLEDDLDALVKSAPETYSALVALGSGTYQVLVKEGADTAAAALQVAEVVRKSGRPPGSAGVATAGRSLAELTALHAQVDALLDEMLAAGADIAGTGPQPRLGKIQIDIEGGQAAAEKVLGPLVDDVVFVPSVTTRRGGSAKPIGGSLSIATSGPQPGAAATRRLCGPDAGR